MIYYFNSIFVCTKLNLINLYKKPSGGLTVSQDISTAKKFEKVCEILEDYKYDSTKLIPILQVIQEEYRYLPEEILAFVATSLKIPPSKVYGVATFFAHFALEPKGKYIIKVCDGTACHVKKSVPIYEALQEKLGLSNGKSTKVGFFIIFSYSLIFISHIFSANI